MDEFTQIQTFIRVVEAGSFSAAAREVSSISSVARQVKRLEDELGVRLLNRSTRSLSLTEPGRRFYERACVIANDLANAKSEATSFQASVKGVLRASFRVSAGTTIIVPALPAFLARHPELTLDISLSDERRDLVASNLDVAVWMGNMPDSEIVARRLTPTKRIVCATPAYLKNHGTPQKPEHLTQHNCLLFTARSYGNGWAFEKDGQQKTIEVQGNVRTDNALVLMTAAMNDLGLIVVNEWMVRSQLAQGVLVKVLDEFTVSPRPGDSELYVVYPSNRGLSLKVRVFVDFLVDLFQGSAGLDQT